MGEFQAMHKYFAIFVALVACHGSIFAHGRQIKPLNQHSSLNTNTVVLAPLRTSINNVPQLKVIDAPIVPKYEFADADSGDHSGAGHSYAFRPTTPGNSPGVGHKKIEEDHKGMKLVHSADVKVSVAEESENDFRPTDLGVGHPRENESGKLN